MLENMLADGGIFDFRPYELIRDLGLLSPKGWSYEDTAAYGHFGRAEFPWEKLDKVSKLKKYFKV
jgi:S-adenosylmethionine synthetase